MEVREKTQTATRDVIETDMRKSFDGLVGAVRAVVAQDPLSVTSSPSSAGVAR